MFTHVFTLLDLVSPAQNNVKRVLKLLEINVILLHLVDLDRYHHLRIQA